MATNKNTLDQPGVVKKIQTALGTISQVAPSKVVRKARTAGQAK